MIKSLAGVAGFVHGGQHAHLILVSVDEQLLQQRIARILAELRFQGLLGTLIAFRLERTLVRDSGGSRARRASRSATARRAGGCIWNP